MDTTITVDMLTADSVSILTQKVATIEGQTYTLGNHRYAYVNSAAGRAQLEAELPEPYRSAVLAVWGDAPTVVEEIPETAPDAPAAE